MRIFVIGLVLFCAVRALPCTTFVLEGEHRVYLGKNLDWDWDDGFVFVNPKEMQKRALVMSTNALTWTSKYGSVTFNQFGRELPFGGMNEAGLVIESMWLGDTKFSASDARPEVNMLQWIQYQLDTSSSVEEVIASDKTIRLENTATRARIHYLVCDATGNSATIEFLNGSMQVHSGKSFPDRALANDTYETSVSVLNSDASRRNVSKPLKNRDSISRFCRAAVRADTFKPAKNSAQDVSYAFDTLNQVRQGRSTVWQIVYNAAARQIHFRTLRNEQQRSVDLKTLNFACNHPMQIANIQSKPSATGAVEFVPFDEEKHHQFLTHFYAQESLKKEVGDLTGMVEPIVSLLRTYKCTEH